MRKLKRKPVSENRKIINLMSLYKNLLIEWNHDNASYERM